MGKQFAANRSGREAMYRHPNEPALADYPWHPDGFAASEWAGAAKAIGLALGLSVFLSMFNWWAFGINGPWMVKGIVGVLDLITLLMWAKAVQQQGCALRFGHSGVIFTRFPYRLSEPVILRWQPVGGVNQVRNGTFTLHCVEEWMESSGSGKNRSTTLVHEETWSGKWVLDHPRNLKLKDAVELRYELPAQAQPTQPTAGKSVFWDLEVKLSLPGLDFNEIYLVPIYGSETPARIEPIMLNG